MTHRIDHLTTCIWMLLLVLGSIVIMSATQAGSHGAINPLVVRQFAYLFVSVLVFVALMNVPLKVTEKFHKVIYLVTLGLATLVLIPWIGVVSGGGRRWIDLGPMTIQVSEVARLLIPIYLAGYLANNKDRIKVSSFATLKPVFWIGIVLLLFIMQPDFGSAVLIGLVTVGLLFIGGARIRDLAILCLIGSAGLVYVFIHRMDRLIAWIDPTSHCQGEAYQLCHSMNAFGRGELTGLGLGDGIEKQLYLPEQHNDFVFSVIAEELGFVGAAIILLILLSLVFRCFVVGKRALEANHDFAGYVSYAAGLMLGLQSFINIGVATGVLPTKGLTLPFISFGGNSLVICTALIAFVCRASIETDPSNVKGNRRA